MFEVRASEVDPADGGVGDEESGDGDALFLIVGGERMDDEGEGVTGEDDLAVLAAVEIGGAGELSIEAGQTREFRGFVKTSRAIGAFVDFLNGDEIGIGLLDDVGDAPEIELFVYTFPVVNVVGHDAEARRIRTSRCDREK